MSARTKGPNALDRLVTKRDLFKVIAAMNEATRMLESRIEELERASDLREIEQAEYGDPPEKPVEATSE